MKFTKISSYFALSLAFAALAVSVVSVMPAAAHADYSYYSDGTPWYGTPIGNRYTYNSSYSYPTYPYPYPTVSPLYVSCSPSQSSIYTGQSVTWTAYASGGYGSYSYSWSGSDGMTGYGQALSFSYAYPGYKTASITVSSGGMVATSNCNTGVTVTSSYYPTPYPYPNPNPYPYYPTLSVSCTPNTSYASIGQAVTWTAYASGGNGYFNYAWSGSENTYGYGQSTNVSYYSPGQKIASVTVTSNGQSVTQSCNSTVNVGGYYNQYPTTYPTNYQPTYPTNYTTSNYNGLDIGCYADPTNATVNQPVTWTVEVTGGTAPYTYSWTGSDGLTGSAATAIKYYSTGGTKSAIVTVSTADGKSGTHACSNTVKVASAYHAPAPAPVKIIATPTPTPTPVESAVPTYQAASLLSLGNVPWGWVAILIILVLFATVMYLLFNKQKI